MWYALHRDPAQRPGSVFRLIILILALLLSAACWGQATASRTPSALVLYDGTPPYTWMGELYSKHLYNLLNHFNLTVTSHPVEAYKPGELKLYTVAFYLGTMYDNALPAAFKSDVMATTTRFCWMGYNLWQVAWTPNWDHNPAFATKYGFRFDGLDNSGYPEVHYKDKVLTKVAYDPTLGKVTITNSSKAVVYAVGVRPNPYAEVPYIVKSGRFWYIADNPMANVTMSDRFLAFADLLHDIIGQNHMEKHRALIRIEDVSPVAPPETLRAIADYLYAEGVPFLISTIPEFVDPLGVYNEGIPWKVRMTDVPEYVAALKYMVARGGQIVQHGYTHQYGSTMNPFTGATGDDWEFMRVKLNAQGTCELVGALPEDSTAWASSRVQAGKRLLVRQGLTPVAWETPHYGASEVDYQAFAGFYRLAVDRGTYAAVNSNGVPMYLTQLLPYITKKDVYGQKRLPENLGYVSPEEYAGQSPILPADMLHCADCELAVRDGWASGYFHWYLDLGYMRELVSGLKQQGYTFVSVYNAIN